MITALIIGACLIYLNTLFLYRAGKVVQEYNARLKALRSAEGHGQGIHKELCAMQWGLESVEIKRFAEDQGKRLHISYYN